MLRTLEGLEMTMSNKSRRLAGILLIVLPTVMYGGVSARRFLARQRAKLNRCKISVGYHTPKPNGPIPTPTRGPP